jgi:hypothetical protein
MSEEKKETVLLHDLEVESYLADCVRIVPEVLNEEFVRLPADLAYWSARYADALRAHLTAKLNLNKVEARAHIECREQLLVEHSRPTESMVEAAVMEYEPLQAARLACIEAEVEKARVGGVVDAIRCKKDMVVSLGATIRAEMEHDPIVREAGKSGAEMGRRT